MLRSIVLFILLAGCASNRPKPGTDPLAHVFKKIESKRFSEVRPSLNKSAHYNDHEVYFKNGRGDDDFGAVRKNWIMASVKELSKAVKKCEKMAGNLASEEDLREFESLCLENSDGTGSLRRWVGQLSQYSNYPLKALLYDNDKRYSQLKSKIDKEKSDLAEAERLSYEQEQLLAQQERERLEKLEKRSDYQKCKLLSDIKSSQKMIDMWNRNIASVKLNAKEAGFVTNRMANSIDKSLASRKAYIYRIERNEKELKRYKGVKVSEKQCRKMMPKFGKSPADQYL